MTIDFLPPELGQFVRDELASGKYGSTDDVVVAAVRLLHERESRLSTLKADIDAGMRQIASGDVVELRDADAQSRFFEDIKSRGAARSRPDP